MPLQLLASPAPRRTYPCAAVFEVRWTQVRKALHSNLLRAYAEKEPVYTHAPTCTGKAIVNAGPAQGFRSKGNLATLEIAPHRKKLLSGSLLRPGPQVGRGLPESQ